jgi:acetate kinase
MGFTPLEGLIMGSRSGDLDPGLLLYLMEQDSITPSQVLNLITYQSGLLGISGRSSDVRDLERYSSEGDENATLALHCFAYRVRKYIGAYAAALGGIDALAFTGGIGEHSAGIRALVCSDLDFLQLPIDAEKNLVKTSGTSEAVEIGAMPGKVWIVPANEELQIAREVVTLLSQ